LGEGKKQNVITANPSANMHIPTGDKGQSLTAIECIAADGLFSGGGHMENWYYEQPSLPENYRIGVTANEYITDAMAYDWLHFFQESNIPGT
jgi:hypothetical protein